MTSLKNPSVPHHAARPGLWSVLPSGKPDEGPPFNTNIDDDPLAMNSVMTSVDTQPQLQPQPQPRLQTQLEARHSDDTALAQQLNGTSAARRKQRRAATVSVRMMSPLR